MTSLVADGALRDRLVHWGKRRAAEFSDTEVMAREYLQLFQFALDNRSLENVLTGAHSDGWIGTRLNLQVASAETAQTLEIEFSAPEWHPQRSLTVKATKDGQVASDPLVFDRGASAILALPVAPSGGHFEIRVGPTFVPSHWGIADDERELSAMLRRCSIVAGDSKRTELFPEKVPG
jgi:hypothetical protein